MNAHEEARKLAAQEAIYAKQAEREDLIARIRACTDKIDWTGEYADDPAESAKFTADLKFALKAVQKLLDWEDAQ